MEQQMMLKQSLLRALRALLAKEHVCVPPDPSATWRPIPERLAERLGAQVYECPECGQRMTRSGDVTQAA
jgi:hypothetical protein